MNIPCVHEKESTDEDLEAPLEDDLEESEVNTSLSADLATWADQFQVKHNAVDGLLKILRSRGHTDLPSCSRTLLKTSRVLKTEYKSNVEMDEERLNKKRTYKHNSKYMNSSDDDQPRWENPPKHKRAKETPLSPPPASMGTSYNASIEQRGNGISWQPGDRAENVPTWAKNIQDTLQVLVRKVESLEEIQRGAIQLFRRTFPESIEVAIVELEVAQTQAELQDLEERLKDTDYRNKVVSHLSLKSGTNPGQCVRRVMRAMASNLVWSAYSLRGRKGKLALLGTVLCMTIKQAVMKWRPGLGEKEIEVLIAETLKHAPSVHIKAQAQWQRELKEDKQAESAE